MAKAVKVTITRNITGTCYVVPYSHHAGLQYVMAGKVRTEQLVMYEVPCYEVTIDRGTAYNAVRFGLQNNGSVLPSRTCDAGLSKAHECTPQWLPSYSPHSFHGSARPGAWQLIPGRGFLIHEGADGRPTADHKIGVGGSLGCVEILNGDWNDFLKEIEMLSHASCAEMSRARAFHVAIESAHVPRATLVM